MSFKDDMEEVKKILAQRDFTNKGAYCYIRFHFGFVANITCKRSFWMEGIYLTR